MGDFDIEGWLYSKSISVARSEDEIAFTHFSNEVSVLALRTHACPIATDNLPEPLARFYEKYRGASLGDEHIIIGTDGPDDLKLELGILLPTLHHMKIFAKNLGIEIDDFEQVFMAEAGWMFAYSYGIDRTLIGTSYSLFRYDRDFRKKRRMDSFEAVLENWWSIVLEDPLEK